MKGETMRNVVLSIVVIAALVTAGIGGTFAGFVDTEVSHDNYVQAGITDLLVNGKNDPDVETKIEFDHAVPGKSTDFWVDLYNWGKCQGGDIYMTFKDCESIEDGCKTHYGVCYVYDGTTVGSGSLPSGVPYGYKAGTDPKGAGVASSEPELGAEEGDFWIGQTWIASGNGTMGVDYASGVGENMDVFVQVPLVGSTGNTLGNPDTNLNGTVNATERDAWEINGNRWETKFSGNLLSICGTKTKLGFLATQTMTFVHVDVVISQIEDPNYPVDYDKDGDIDSYDEQLKWWPTNALQGDKAMWDMMFELTTDP
jgi:hypothetical protein